MYLYARISCPTWVHWGLQRCLRAHRSTREVLLVPHVPSPGTGLLPEPVPLIQNRRSGSGQQSYLLTTGVFGNVGVGGLSQQIRNPTHTHIARVCGNDDGERAGRSDHSPVRIQMESVAATPVAQRRRAEGTDLRAHAGRRRARCVRLLSVAPCCGFAVCWLQEQPGRERAVGNSRHLCSTGPLSARMWSTLKSSQAQPAQRMGRQLDRRAREGRALGGVAGSGQHERCGQAHRAPPPIQRGSMLGSEAWLRPSVTARGALHV